MPDREIIARWAGHTVTRLLDDPTLGIVPWIRTDGYDRAYMPDVGIDEWHGKGGLLEKIEEKELQGAFMTNLVNSLGVEGRFDYVMWEVRNAEPAQLTAALVALKEVSDGSK